MALSAEEKDALKARYDVRGLDAVRRDVERDEFNGRTDSDVAVFARAWVASEEAKLDRTIHTFKIVAAVFFSLFGAIIVWFLIN